MYTFHIYIYNSEAFSIPPWDYTQMYFFQKAFIGLKNAMIGENMVLI